MALPQLVVDVWQIAVMHSTFAVHVGILGGLFAACAPLEAMMLEESGSQEVYLALYYTLGLPLVLMAWVVGTSATVVAVKWILFPFGMRAAGCHAGRCRWEYAVNGWGYLRWWTLDHVFRSTKPLLFSAVLRRSRLAALYYRALGMRINPLQTIHCRHGPGGGRRVGLLDCPWQRHRPRHQGLRVRL